MTERAYKVIAVFPIESTICTTVELSEPLPQKGEAVVVVFPETWRMRPVAPYEAERKVYREMVRLNLMRDRNEWEKKAISYAVKNQPGYSFGEYTKGTVENALDFFYYVVLELAGQTAPKPDIRVIRKYLLCYDDSENYTKNDTEMKKRFGVECEAENGLLLILLYLLNNKNIIEYGTSIFYGWLTDEGRMLLALLKSDKFFAWEREEVNTDGMS